MHEGVPLHNLERRANPDSYSDISGDPKGRKAWACMEDAIGYIDEFKDDDDKLVLLGQAVMERFFDECGIPPWVYPVIGFHNKLAEARSRLWAAANQPSVN